MRSIMVSMAVVIGLVFGLTGCAHLPSSVEPPEVSLADLRPVGSTLFEHRVDIGLRVRNLNNFSLPLYGIRCALDVNGRPLLQGTSRENLSIPALSSSVVRVEGVVTSLDLLRHFGELPGDKGVRYHLTGTAYLTRDLSRAVPFSYEGAMPSLFSAP